MQMRLLFRVNEALVVSKANAERLDYEDKMAQLANKEHVEDLVKQAYKEHVENLELLALRDKQEEQVSLVLKENKEHVVSLVNLDGVDSPERVVNRAQEDLPVCQELTVALDNKASLDNVEKQVPQDQQVSLSLFSSNGSDYFF